MIKLFNPTDTDFSSNGIVVLHPLKTFENKQKSLNGWSIDVELDLKHKDLISQDMLAVVKTKSKFNPQAFRIKNIKFTNRKIIFKAEHVMFDTQDYYLKDVRPTNMSAVGALNYVNERTDSISPFSFTSDVNNASTAYFLDRSLFYAMQIIEERWGGEFDADNFHISLKKNVGVDRGEAIIYGKNLEGIQIYEDWNSVATKIFPVGFDGLRLPEGFLEAEFNYPKPYTKRIDIDTDSETSIEEQILELRDKSQSWLDENKYPKVAYEVKSDVNQELEIGDIVHVRHPLVNLATSVQEYDYNILTKRVTKVVFGNYNRSVKKRFDQIKNAIQEVRNKTSIFETVINNQTDLINSLNKFGHVYIDDNQILILDKLPKETAKNVWRWNMGGLGFSENGIEGPFKQAWTIDGVFNTEFIAAHSITVNHLAADIGSALDLSSNESINLLIEKIELNKTFFAYSANSNGNPMTATPNVDSRYIGTASATARPTDYTSYNWTLIRGADGSSSYTHIAYATSSSGDNFSTLHFADATYIGMYVDSVEQDSATPSKYNWSLIQGADGHTPYFHTAWANNSTGTSGFSTTVSTDKLYIGTYADFNQADSTDPSKYSWTKIKGDKGQEGDGLFIAYADNETGSQGFSLSDNTKDYQGIYVGQKPQSTNYLDYDWTKSNNKVAKEISTVSLKLDGAENSINALTSKTDALESSATKLALDLDGVKTSVRNAMFDDVLSNGNFEFGDYSNWTFPITNDPLTPFTGLYAREGMTQFTTFDFVENPNSLAGGDLRFFANGKAINGIYRIYSDYGYSTRVKRSSGTQPFTFFVDEYNDDNGFIKTQTFDFTEPNLFEQVQDIVLSQNTRYVAVGFITTGLSSTNPLRLTEWTFGIGEPKIYKKTASSVLDEVRKNFVTNSEFKHTSEGIELDISKLQTGLVTAEDKLNETRTFFRVTSDGLKLGGTDWETYAHITGDMIAFKTKTGEAKAEFGAGGMYVNKWQTDFHVIGMFESGDIRGTIFLDRKLGD